jgi:hypothetical protein
LAEECAGEQKIFPQIQGSRRLAEELRKRLGVETFQRVAGNRFLTTKLSFVLPSKNKEEATRFAKL